MSDTLVNDIDPIETQDWLSAVDSLIRAEGAERAHYIINQVIDQARNGGVNIAKGGVTTPYVNTIPLSEQPAYPGDKAIERRIRTELNREGRRRSYPTLLRKPRNLLLVAPLKGRVVLGFDPAFRTGAKLAVVNQTGKLIATQVIYPVAPASQAKIAQAKKDFG